IHICTVLTGQIGNIADIYLVRSFSMKPPLYQVCENWIRRAALGSHAPATLGKATQLHVFMIRATFLRLTLANSLASLSDAAMRVAPYKPFSSSKTAAIRAPSTPSAHVLATRRVWVAFHL